MTEATTHTTFSITLATAKAADSQEATPRILATASSDQIDLGQDRFALSALNQMEKQFPGKTLFLNHSYKVPEDVAGVIKSATVVKRNGHSELDITCAINAVNSRAIDAYNQVISGVTLGISVGVIITATEWVKVDGLDILEIRGIKALEASIVGIPANQESWIQGALKAASFFATDSVLKEATNSEVITAPASASEVDTWRFVAHTYRLAAKVAEHERDEIKAGAGELLDIWRQLSALPMRRKALDVPPDLDARIDRVGRLKELGIDDAVIRLAESTRGMPAPAVKTPRKAR